jgi:hypothetical protein
MIKTRNLASFLVVLIAVLLSACAGTVPEKPDAAVDPVVERAKARWEAILSRNYADAYALYSPGYRSTVSATDFEIGLRLRRVRWVSSEYQRHECKKDSCVVTFRVGFRAASPVPGLDSWSGYDLIEDQWVKTGGEWWYLPEE